MPKRPPFSRWRRLPGVYRSGEVKPPDPDADQERLTLYLPPSLMDRAEALANREGARSIQDYCERLIRTAIDLEFARHKLEDDLARRGPMEGLDEIANDPDFLNEWSASKAPRKPPGPPATPRDGNGTGIELEGPRPGLPLSAPGQSERAASAVEVVLRHAALLGDDPAGLLATLRRGETIDPDSAQELLQALIDLENELRDAPQIERRLSYALHRLAFEGQVLLTDAFPGLSDDAGTVETLRLIQEGVDRVLSGENIRYYTQEGPDEAAGSHDDPYPDDIGAGPYD